ANATIFGNPAAGSDDAMSRLMRLHGVPDTAPGDSPADRLARGNDERLRARIAANDADRALIDEQLAMAEGRAGMALEAKEYKEWLLEMEGWAGAGVAGALDESKAKIDVAGSFS